MRKKPIQLTLPHPCSESRRKMKKTASGYFCKACESEVIDYRAFSDVELLNALQSRAGKPCGIFREDQLNRKIYPDGQSCTSFAHAWKTLGLLAGLSLAPQPGDLTAQTQQNIAVRESGNPAVERQILPATTQVRYLSGHVRNWYDEQPVKNARVRFEEGGKTVRTDKYGRFKIILPDDYNAEFVTVSVTTRRKYRPYYKKLRVVALPAEGLAIELREIKERDIMGSPRVFF